MGELVVVVHPDDINLADAKALAADYNTHVVGNPYTPRGQAFLMPHPERMFKRNDEGGSDGAE